MNSPDSPPAKKSLSGLTLAGIGCGVALLIAIVGAVAVFGFFARKVNDTVGDFQKNPAKAAAVLAVKSNPELELVKTDDTTGEITVRNKNTGEETTMALDEVAQGKFRVKNANGETTIGGGSAATTPPEWVPAYPAAKTQSGGMKMEKTDSIAGAFTAQTPDPTSQVKSFFESKLRAEGFEIEATTANTAGSDSAVVSGHKEDGKRTITVLINADKGMTSLVINYEGPK